MSLGSQDRFMPVRSATLVLACLACFCGAPGCNTVPAKQGRLERDSSNSQVSSHQLRVMVNEFVVHYASRVELTADNILAQSTDPTIRRNALLWKINGISSCFQAASRPDPLGAYLDIWILNRQMAQMFNSPAGDTLFGQAQLLARAECADLEARLQYINQVAGADLPLGEKFVTKFATDYPLTTLYFDREPIASRYIQEVREPAREMFQIVANLEENLVQMRNLAVIHAEYLPKQARWEAELLLIDTSQQEFVQQPIRDLSLASHSIAQIAHTTEIVPAVVEQEREAFQQFLSHEREVTLGELERMRQETLAAVGRERVAVLEAVHEERLAISQQIDTQMALVLQATDDLSRRRVEQAAAEAPVVIDHFFRRTVQLGGVLLLLVMAYLLLIRRSQPLAKASQPAPTIRGGFADDRASAA